LTTLLQVDEVCLMPATHTSSSSSAQLRRTKRARQQASDAPDPAFATTLAHGLQVMEAFRPGDGALSNGELAARSKLSRPTVSRLTNTLVQLGYLKRDAAARYKLGTRVLGIAYPLLAGLKIRQLARPLMREFAADAGGTVSLAMPIGLEFIYVETVRTTDATAHVPEIGFSSALAPTAVGRALLSLYSEAEFKAYDEAMNATQREQWALLRPATLAAITDCSTRGYCVSLGEWRAEIYGVAAPLFRTADGECLAVNCGIPSFRFSREEVEHEFGPRMLGLAQSIRSLAGSA
jgi:DNA-binding IclR family transcriptional regulator